MSDGLNGRWGPHGREERVGSILETTCRKRGKLICGVEMTRGALNRRISEGFISLLVSVPLWTYRRRRPPYLLS